MTTLQGNELETATKDITDAMRAALETCVERGMKLPFILCSASPNGSVICMRVHGGGVEPEHLCEHFEPEGFRMPATLMVLDQNGEAARVTITVERTIFH
jgi:hypothetical protein